MKKNVLIFLLMIVSAVCVAQEERTVYGVVRGETRGPVSGAVVSAVEFNLFTKTDSLGRFEISLPESVKQIQIVAPGYHTLDQVIDSPFLVCDMNIDKDYASKAYKIASIEAKLAQNAEQKVIDEERAKEETERLAKVKALDDLYNQEYKNKGFVHSVELSYGYQLSHEDVIYKNLGFIEYGSLNPVEVNYTLSYRFNYIFSCGVGTGLQYQTKNLCTLGDVFEPVYMNREKFTPLNVPLFLNLKMTPTRGKVQPLISFSGGIYLPNYEALVDVGAGVNLRLNRNANMYMVLSCRMTPYGEFKEYSGQEGLKPRPATYVYYTKSVWAPSFKIGFTL